MIMVLTERRYLFLLLRPYGDVTCVLRILVYMYLLVDRRDGSPSIPDMGVYQYQIELYLIDRSPPTVLYTACIGLGNRLLYIYVHVHVLHVPG